MGAPSQVTSELKWKDETSQGEGVGPLFSGSVLYDVEVTLPGSSSPVHVSASFPRLLPKHERAPICPSDLAFLTAKLDPWIKKHFSSISFGRENYLPLLNKATSLFTYHVYPTCPLDSIKMELALKLYFWLWFNDDLIENAIYKDNPIDPKILKKGTDQLDAVLLGSPKPFVEVEGYHWFQPLYNSLLELTQDVRKLTKDYDASVKRLHKFLKQYHEAIRWYVLDKIDGRYSLAHFRHWRRLIAFFDGIAEVMCILEDLVLKEEIAESALLNRLLEVANNFGGIGNDILGMHKEFGSGEKDNTIAFAVLEKDIPLDSAVKEACEFLTEELSDYLRVRKVILQEFGNDKNLEKFLDILDSLIDGHNCMYLHSSRHMSVGFTGLTR